MLTINLPLDFRFENKKIREESRERRFRVDKLFGKMIYQSSRDDGVSITFDHLREHKLNVEFDFPSINDTSIVSYRVDTGSHKTLRFISKFSKSAVIKRHVHPDCDEVFYVPKGSGGRFLIISGMERDGTLEYNVLTEDDNGAIIKAGTVHQISNIGKESELITEVHKI